MTKTGLSMTDFEQHYEFKRLGRLEFPNGIRSTGLYQIPNGTGPFAIALRELYDLVTGEKEVPLDEVVGVLAFGSAVQHPGYTQEVHTRKKYGFFGPEIEKTKIIPVQPTHADFLVVTRNDIERDGRIAAVTTGSDGRGMIKKGGIHVIHRGIEYVLGESSKTVESAMREGVPVLLSENSDALKEGLEAVNQSPRQVYWDKEESGDLIGRIK